MKGRTAVVTGGSRGIGRAVCIRLAKEGANIVFSYVSNADAAAKTAEECKALGAEVVSVKGDVAKKEDCENLIKIATENFGKIDILVNNAGITRDNILMMMSDEEFDEVIQTNLKGTYMMMKQMARPMMKKRYGRIINLSSVVGIMGNPGQVNYAASKAGVIGMTKSFAKEIATKGVTVNAVAPGFIITDMTGELSEEAAKAINAQIPMQKRGIPEDIANAVAFLAKEESSYITGQVINVDGGML